MADAVLDITGDTFRKHFLDQVCQHSPVLWVKNVEPLTEDRDALIWIETENHERFGRPIIKYPVWPERPTTHMSEPFSLPQIKFASFQLARLLCNPLLSTFPVFDIDARAEPFRDVPVLITKGHFSMQKRTISSVSAPNTRFYFQRFTARQSGMPFLNQGSDIFRMDTFGPFPSANLFE